MWSACAKSGGRPVNDSRTRRIFARPLAKPESTAAVSSQHPRDILVDTPDTRDILARMLYGYVARVGRVGRLSRSVCHVLTWLVDRRCIALPVCPCAVSFSKFLEPDMHDLLRISNSPCISPVWATPGDWLGPRGQVDFKDLETTHLYTSR